MHHSASMSWIEILQQLPYCHVAPALNITTSKQWQEDFKGLAPRTKLADTISYSWCITPVSNRCCTHCFYWNCSCWHMLTKKYCDFPFTPSMGWMGLWGFMWWTPSAKRKDNHGVSSGWSSTWFHSNTGLSSTQCEQISIIFGVWAFWLTTFFFWSIPFWHVYGYCISSVEVTLFWVTYYCSIGPCFSVRV